MSDEKMVLVSRNDAAMLDVLRRHLTSMGGPWKRMDAEDRLTTNPYVRGRVLRDGTEAMPLYLEVTAHRNRFETLAYEWLDGKDVLIAKLSQQ